MVSKIFKKWYVIEAFRQNCSMYLPVLGKNTIVCVSYTRAGHGRSIDGVSRWVIVLIAARSAPRHVPEPRGEESISLKPLNQISGLIALFPTELAGNAVWCQINWYGVITIHIWFNLTRFLNRFLCASSFLCWGSVWKQVLQILDLIFFCLYKSYWIS